MEISRVNQKSKNHIYVSQKTKIDDRILPGCPSPTDSEEYKMVVWPLSGHSALKGVVATRISDPIFEEICLTQKRAIFLPRMFYL